MAQMPPPSFVEGAAKNDAVVPFYDDKEKHTYDEEDGKVVAANEYYDPKSKFSGIASPTSAKSALDPTDVYPTEEEAATLPRVPDSVPLASYLVALVELGERFSYYGTTGMWHVRLAAFCTIADALASIVVFTNFIQRPLPPGSTTGSAGTDGQPGALDMGQKVSVCDSRSSFCQKLT